MSQTYQKRSSSSPPPSNYDAPPPPPLKLSDLPATRLVAVKYGIPEEQLRLILTVCPATAKDLEVASLVYQSARTGLDPLARQIYLVSRSGKCSVQTGIDGYRLVADRTGQYVGSSDPVFDEGLSQFAWLSSERSLPKTATITVKKLVGGIIGEFTATAAWDSYFPGDKQGYMWVKMPLLMLGKVSEALALRKAFPAELSGIYTSEEMMQAGESEGDPSVTSMLKEVGVKNSNALTVIDKLKEVGIEPNDQRIVSMIGYAVGDVPATAEGSELLKKVWAAAVAIKKGTSPDVAFATE